MDEKGQIAVVSVTFVVIAVLLVLI